MSFTKVLFQRTWQGNPDSSADDLQFTLDIIDDLKASYVIDESRMYATGKSVGAGFVGVLAVRWSSPTHSSKFKSTSKTFTCNSPSVSSKSPHIYEHGR